MDEGGINIANDNVNVFFLKFGNRFFIYWQQFQLNVPLMTFYGKVCMLVTTCVSAYLHALQ